MLVPCLRFKINRVYRDGDIYFMPLRGKGNVWTIVMVDENKVRENVVFQISKLYEELSEEEGMARKVDYL